MGALGANPPVGRAVGGDYFLGLPGGGTNPDETPKAAIRRKILEEVGLEADKLITLPRHRYLGSLVASMGNPFLALGVRQIQPAPPERVNRDHRIASRGGIRNTLCLQGFRRGRGHHPAPVQTHPYRTRA
ncbi:MAG: hypothetical protein C4332_13440, partial [Meiothermus sp.]